MARFISIKVSGQTVQVRVVGRVNGKEATRVGDSEPVGRGETVDEAVEDLRLKLLTN